MESSKIEALLEKYFEAETTLTEEQVLREYFTNKANVAPHLSAYTPLFEGFVAAKQETSKRSVLLPAKERKVKPFWYGIAASLVVAIAVAGFAFSKPSLTAEEEEALANFNKTREAMQLMSAGLNQGAEELSFINQFTTNKNKVFK